MDLNHTQSMNENILSLHNSIALPEAKYDDTFKIYNGAGVNLPVPSMLISQNQNLLIYCHNCKGQQVQSR